MVNEHFVVQRWRGLSPKAAALVLVVAAGVNGGCEMPRIPGLYRIDIQQGNIVNQEMIDQLEIGMERRKVSFILGTPLLADPFNQDRWDYLYSLRTGSGTAVTQRLSVYFADDRLVRIENHLEPGVVPVLEERTQTLVKVPQREPRESVFGELVPDVLKRIGEPEGGDVDGAPLQAAEDPANAATSDESRVESSE